MSNMQNHDSLILFCPMCFADEDGGSWGAGVDADMCHNCCAVRSAIEIPRWAAESIRGQASWVGCRYYPNQEDRERFRETRALRALPVNFPGRTSKPVMDEVNSYWVTQRMPGGATISSVFKAVSEEDAIEASRLSLPYVSAEELE